MEYRVEQLAAAAGVGVDTVRFYQHRGLLPPPRRHRRTALYSEAHLERLKRIRGYQSQGLPLAVIKRVLGGRAASRADALLAAVADESGERSIPRSQLAEALGVPEALLASLETAGLLEPVPGGEGPRYGEADLEMGRAGLEILRQGFPLDELVQLAVAHAGGVRQVADAAIDLFDRYVRGGGEAGADAGGAAAAFRRLLPAATTLVALHFQRTLLNRALDRLRDRGDQEGLAAAAAALRGGRLEVRWR